MKTALANKKNVLYVSLHKNPSFQPFIDMLKQHYHEVCSYCIHEGKRYFAKSVNDINQLIQSKMIEVVFFYIDDWPPFSGSVNYFFINQILCSKKVGISWDDLYGHDFNLITAGACDLISTACPISVLKYQERGHRAILGLLGQDDNVFKDYKTPKDIDVLYYGRRLGLRNTYLDYIRSSGIDVKIVTEQDEAYGCDIALAKLISRAKIVVNFPQVLSCSKPKRIHLREFQFKGRLLQAALCGTLCVSGYAPAHQLISLYTKFLEFHSKEECVRKIKYFLSCPAVLEYYTKKNHEAAKNYYVEKKFFLRLDDTIESMGPRQNKLIYIPYWYLRRCAREVICRDFAVYNTADFQIIFTMLRNASSLWVKLAVYTESVACFILYYPLVVVIQTNLRKLEQVLRPFKRFVFSLVRNQTK